MARPLRIEYSGAYYHVTAWGNERKAIFRDDTDREKFLDLVGRSVEQFDLRLHADTPINRNGNINYFLQALFFAAQ